MQEFEASYLVEQLADLKTKHESLAKSVRNNAGFALWLHSSVKKLILTYKQLQFLINGLMASILLHFLFVSVLMQGLKSYTPIELHLLQDFISISGLLLAICIVIFWIKARKDYGNLVAEISNIKNLDS